MYSGSSYDHVFERYRYENFELVKNLVLHKRGDDWKESPDGYSFRWRCIIYLCIKRIVIDLPFFHPSPGNFTADWEIIFHPMYGSCVAYKDSIGSRHFAVDSLVVTVDMLESYPKDDRNRY